MMGDKLTGGHVIRRIVMTGGHYCKLRLRGKNVGGYILFAPITYDSERIFMEYVNRSLAIIKPRQPFYDWLKDMPDWDFDLSLETLRVDCTALLLPEFEEPEGAVGYIDEIFERVFEMELASWYEDERVWPQKRSLKMFWEWFDVELHSMVIDATDEVEGTPPAESLH
jgi:hypothetical protein